jgi:hypothetical protein
MQRIALLCALTLSCVAAQAQGAINADLMKTPACIEARRQLEQVLEKGGPRERLDEVRQQAAIKCLGVKAPPLPEGRFVPPPVAVTVGPIRLRSEASLPAMAIRPNAPSPGLQATPPLPPVAIPRPPVLTTCDPGGCWDANGARYTQQGPVLLGPRGACTPQGGLLNCP